MMYVLIEYKGERDIDEPTDVYVELDGERKETRRIEFYPNGLCFSYGDEKGHEEVLRPDPYPEDLTELETDENTFAHKITGRLFEEFWNKSIEMPDGFMSMFF